MECIWKVCEDEGVPMWLKGGEWPCKSMYQRYPRICRPDEGLSVRKGYANCSSGS